MINDPSLALETVSKRLRKKLTDIRSFRTFKHPYCICGSLKKLICLLDICQSNFLILLYMSRWSIVACKEMVRHSGNSEGDKGFEYLNNEVHRSPYLWMSQLPRRLEEFVHGEPFIGGTRVTEMLEVCLFSVDVSVWNFCYKCPVIQT